MSAPTELQQRVWQALTLIPRGNVTTYALLARHLGTRATRAVATAVGKNPSAPKVPCHRVVRSTGEVGKYSGLGGQKAKIQLLIEEGIEVKGGKVQELDKVLYNFT